MSNARDTVIQREDWVNASAVDLCAMCGIDVDPRDLPPVRLHLPRQSVRFHADCFTTLTSALVIFRDQVLPFRSGKTN